MLWHRRGGSCSRRRMRIDLRLIERCIHNEEKLDFANGLGSVLWCAGRVVRFSCKVLLFVSRKFIFLKTAFLPKDLRVMVRNSKHVGSPRVKDLQKGGCASKQESKSLCSDQVRFARIARIGRSRSASPILQRRPSVPLTYQ